MRSGITWAAIDGINGRVLEPRVIGSSGIDGSGIHLGSDARTEHALEAGSAVGVDSARGDAAITVTGERRAPRCLAGCAGARPIAPGCSDG